MQALSGIKGVLESMPAVGVSRLHVEVVDGISPVQIVKNVLSMSPDIIVSIGTPATDMLASSGISVPVIYSMVLDPSDSVRNRPGFAGVVLDIPLGEQIAWFSRIVPDVENLSVLYSEESEAWLSRIREAATVSGVEITGIRFSGRADLVDALSSVVGRTQGLLAIPDGTIYNQVITPRIIYFTLENRLPFMGLSSNFTRAGALFSLDCDYVDIGRQTGEMAARILLGENIDSMPDEFPERITPVINIRSARILGIKIREDIQKKAVIINR